MRRSLAENIQALLADKSVAALARELRVAPSTVRRWRNGEVKMPRISERRQKTISKRAAGIRRSISAGNRRKYKKFPAVESKIEIFGKTGYWRRMNVKNLSFNRIIDALRWFQVRRWFMFYIVYEVFVVGTSTQIYGSLAGARVAAEMEGEDDYGGEVTISRQVRSTRPPFDFNSHRDWLIKCMLPYRRPEQGGFRHGREGNAIGIAMLKKEIPPDYWEKQQRAAKKKAKKKARKK